MCKWFITPADMLHVLCEMDQKVEPKQEPVWHEGTASTSFENYELLSDVTHLKEEIKSELVEPRQTEPSANVKDEIIIDHHAVDQLVPCFKEEKNVGNVSTLNKDSSHSCRICKKAFNQRSALMRHLLTHTKERTYYCNKCNRTFSRRRNFEQHQLRHSRQKAYHCSLCKKTFPLKCRLEGHLFLHTGDRPHRCNQCEASFAQRKTLKQHMLVHSEERPYSCTICKNVFTRRGCLKKHLLTQCGGNTCHPTN